MAKIGRKPLPIPDKVKVTSAPEGLVVEGPKGKLSCRVPKGIQVVVKDSQASVVAEKELSRGLAFQGLVRGLLRNMMQGVTEGFQKELQLQGVGFRAALKGQNLEILLGFSHTIVFPIAKGITVKVPKPTVIVVEGIDKVAVGETAARLRAFYPPEPYKGKGVRYKGEQVRRKQGKTVG